MFDWLEGAFVSWARQSRWLFAAATVGWVAGLSLLLAAVVTGLRRLFRSAPPSDERP
jgi:hypothetical protein